MTLSLAPEAAQKYPYLTIDANRGYPHSAISFTCQRTGDRCVAARNGGSETAAGVTPSPGNNGCDTCNEKPKRTSLIGVGF